MSFAQIRRWLEHDELRLKSRESSPSPRLRGEGWGEGAFQQVLTRRNAPSPGLLRNPTSPRKRGEVNEGGRADSTSIHHALIVLFIVLISTSHSWRVAKPVRFTIIRTAGQIIKGLNCGDLRRHILRRCASVLSKGEKCRPS